MFRPISINEFVKKHIRSNPGEKVADVRSALNEAVKSKREGATCFCGQPIWAIGSAMSGTVEQPNLTRHVSPEERDELLRKAFDAFDRGDEETGYSYFAQVPLLPSLAEFAFERRGREYCETHFNLSEANAKFGEGWMND